MPPSDPPRFEEPLLRRQLDLWPLRGLLMSLYPNVGDFELALKLGLGRNLADIAPETLQIDCRYLKVLEALGSEGRLLDLRQALLEQGDRAQRADDIADAFNRVLGPPPPEDFGKRHSVLGGATYSRNALMALASRAALRVTPVLGRNERDGAPGAILLPPLRATAVPWVGATWPITGADHLSAATSVLTLPANLAASHAKETVTKAPDDAVSAATVAAQEAAVVVFEAAAAGTRVSEAFIAATAAVDAANLGSVGTANAADATAIFGGLTAAGLARRPLWMDERMPHALQDAWGALKARLLAREGEHWEVWTEWYEARLRGDPGNPALEYERVTSPEIDWEAGPAAVNAKIKEIIERHEGSSSAASFDEKSRDDDLPSASAEEAFAHPSLNYSLGEFSTDPVSGEVRMLPRRADAPRLEGPRQEFDWRSRLSALGESSKTLLAGIQEEKPNIRETFRLDISYYAEEAAKGPDAANPALLDEYGSVLQSAASSDMIMAPLSEYLTIRVRRLVASHGDFIEAYHSWVSMRNAAAGDQPLAEGRSARELLSLMPDLVEALDDDNAPSLPPDLVGLAARQGAMAKSLLESIDLAVEGEERDRLLPQAKGIGVRFWATVGKFVEYKWRILGGMSVAGGALGAIELAVSGKAGTIIIAALRILGLPL
ncbi:MAG: hypothetical protein AAFQ81_04590 [Pseudomonadota bacterium]